MVQGINELLLQWFLEFINADLKKLTSNDRSKLVVDLAEALNYPIQKAFSAPSKEELVPAMFAADTNTWRASQGRLVELVAAMERGIQELESKRAAGLQYSANGDDYFNPISLAKIPLNIEMTLSLKLGQQLPATTTGKAAGPSSKRTSKSDALNSTLFWVSATSDCLEDVLTYNFCQLLNDLPTSIIMRCKLCGRLFIRTTQRQRVFCSSRCATKSSNKKRYYEDKEKSLSGAKPEEGLTPQEGSTLEEGLTSQEEFSPVNELDFKGRRLTLRTQKNDE